MSLYRYSVFIPVRWLQVVTSGLWCGLRWLFAVSFDVLLCIIFSSYQTLRHCLFRVGDLQKKWTGIRSTFSKEINKEKASSKSGSGKRTKKVYKFAAQLQFLRPFMRINRMIDNVQRTNSEDLVKTKSNCLLELSQKCIICKCSLSFVLSILVETHGPSDLLCRCCSAPVLLGQHHSF